MPESSTIHIRLRNPGGSEREVTFDRDVIRIGRARDCDLSLESGFISRYHARIERLDDGWEVIDEGSKNGVFVNGQRVGTSASQPLHQGDSLRVGDYGLTVEYEEEDDLDRTVIIPPAARGGPAQPEPTVPNEAGMTQPPAMSRAAEAAEPSPAPEPVTIVEDQEPDFVPETAVSETSEPASTAPTSEPPAPLGKAGGGLVVDSAARRVTWDGQPLPSAVSNRELDLLIALTGQSPRSQRELIEAVWGAGGGDEEMLERLVHRTQLKLQPVASDRRLLIQVPDGGYRLGD